MTPAPADEGELPAAAIPAVTAHPTELVPDPPSNLRNILVGLAPLATLVGTLLAGHDVSRTVQVILAAVASAGTSAFAIAKVVERARRSGLRAKVALAQLDAAAKVAPALPALNLASLDGLATQIAAELGPAARKALATSRPRRP